MYDPINGTEFYRYLNLHNRNGCAFQADLLSADNLINLNKLVDALA